MRHHESPFTGPATFFKAPHRPDADRGEAHIGILGVPYDDGAGFRSGARFGPAALREATGRYAFGSEGFFDGDGATMRLVGARLVDVGDDVADFLEANRNPDETGQDANCPSFFFGERTMGGAGGVGGDGARIPQVSR